MKLISVLKSYLSVIIIGVVIMSAFLFTYNFFNKKQQTYKGTFVYGERGEFTGNGNLY